MQEIGKKILVSIFLFFLATSAKAYEIKGFIQLEANWEGRIYLSAIHSFDDMYTASEGFVIASAPIQPDGSFVIEGLQLPLYYAMYRLHVVKKGDPVGTLIIRGQEENHYHFVMNNESRLQFINNGPLFTGARFQNSPVNNSFNRLKEGIDELQKAPDIPSKTNWDYQEKQLQEYLLQYADTSQNELTALYALYHLNFEQDYPKYKSFLRYFLKKWKQSPNSSPYLLQLEQQVEFLRYQQSSRIYPYGMLLLLLTLGIIIYTLWKKRNKTASVDPFLQKQNQLTIQEQKIFKLLAKGKANKEISRELNIEVSTVKSHLNNIYGKLGVKSRKEIYNRGNKEQKETK